MADRCSLQDGWAATLLSPRGIYLNFGTGRYFIVLVAKKWAALAHDLADAPPPCRDGDLVFARAPPTWQYLNKGNIADIAHHPYTVCLVRGSSVPLVFRRHGNGVQYEPAIAQALRETTMISKEHQAELWKWYGLGDAPANGDYLGRALFVLGAGRVPAIHFCTRASRLPPALTRENFWQSTGSTTSRLLGEGGFFIFLAHTNEISDESFRIPGADHYCSDKVNSGALCAFALPPGEQQAALDAYAKPAPPKDAEVTAEEDEIMTEVIQCFRNDPSNEEEVEPAMEEIEKRQRQRRHKKIQQAKEKGKRVRAARRAKARAAAKAKAKAKASGPSPPPPPVGPGAPSPPEPKAKAKSSGPPLMPPVVGPSAPSEADRDAEPPPKKRHVNPAKVGRSGTEWSIFRFAPFQRTSVGVICGKTHRTVVSWPPRPTHDIQNKLFSKGGKGVSWSDGMGRDARLS